MLSAHAHSNARSVDWLVRAYFAVAASRSLGLVFTYLDSADPTAKGYRVVAWVAPVNVWAGLLALVGVLLVLAAIRPGCGFGRSVLVMSFALNIVLGTLIGFTWAWVPMMVMFIVAAVLDAVFAVVPYVSSTSIAPVRWRSRLRLP